ncbi:uncharacterized protein LOC124444565 [Xenia sp. Carnegie-2017]|uniref:uncharacterized protein LOC124444565 n=1 Tax=Xenia sp. Carnegie-2017 TaxID=2897299 RepID=UPI001F048095|nr:uncharacterized protein LOC124444565 [Xenia sp. Carnegie-2017]
MRLYTKSHVNVAIIFVVIVLSFAFVWMRAIGYNLSSYTNISLVDRDNAEDLLKFNYLELQKAQLQTEYHVTKTANDYQAESGLGIGLGVSQTCINNGISLDNFNEVLNNLKNTRIEVCRSAHALFSRLFYFRKSETEVVLSDTFSKKVLSWFNGDEKLLESTKHQFILVIMNKYTKDATLLNPLRNKRPGFAGAEDVDKLMTGKDIFGYLDSKYSAAIANTFKIERFHGLAIWKHHNPLEFNEEQFLDLMNLSQEWFRKCFDTDPNFTLPSFLWDILPKASASQIHPHVHMFVSKDFYFSGWEKIFHATNEYKMAEGGNYFNDLIKIHTILQLSITNGDSVAFVSVTPSVSNEVVILSKHPGRDLFVLFYRIMKAFIKMKLYAISAGGVFPSLNPASSKKKMPCIIRIAYRGAIDKARSDISSMELFGSGNINVDLWQFKKQLLQHF